MTDYTDALVGHSMDHCILLSTDYQQLEQRVYSGGNNDVLEMQMDVGMSCWYVRLFKKKRSNKSISFHEKHLCLFQAWPTEPVAAWDGLPKGYVCIQPRRNAKVTKLVYFKNDIEKQQPQQKQQQINGQRIPAIPNFWIQI